MSGLRERESTENSQGSFSTRTTTDPSTRLWRGLLPLDIHLLDRDDCSRSRRGSARGQPWAAVRRQDAGRLGLAGRARPSSELNPRPRPRTGAFLCAWRRRVKHFRCRLDENNTVPAIESKNEAWRGRVSCGVQCNDCKCLEWHEK